MSNEFEYYIGFRSNDDSIPLLIQDKECPNYIFEDELIEKPQLMKFKIRKPIPRKPKMADYLLFEGSVISKKIFDVLQPLKINGIQLLPSLIIGKDDEEFSDHWTLHIYNSIQCVDQSLSECEFNISYLGDVKKIVLSKNILKKIPLNERLIFRLGEDSSFELFHISIVEKIMAVNPVGIKFTDIEKWKFETPFEA